MFHTYRFRPQNSFNKSGKTDSEIGLPKLGLMYMPNPSKTLTKRFDKISDYQICSKLFGDKTEQNKTKQNKTKHN